MSNGAAARDERVSDWQPWRAWVSGSAASIFQSHASFEWFARRHRDELIESGQFKMVQNNKMSSQENVTAYCIPKYAPPNTRFWD